MPYPLISECNYLSGVLIMKVKTAVFAKNGFLLFLCVGSGVSFGGITGDRRTLSEVEVARLTSVLPRPTLPVVQSVVVNPDRQAVITTFRLVRDMRNRKISRIIGSHNLNTILHRVNDEARRHGLQKIVHNIAKHNLKRPRAGVSHSAVSHAAMYADRDTTVKTFRILKQLRECRNLRIVGDRNWNEMAHCVKDEARRQGLQKIVHGIARYDVRRSSE